MNRRAACRAFVLAGLFIVGPAHAAGVADKAYEPISGQAGKDVAWVPTPPALIDGAAMQGKRHVASREIFAPAASAADRSRSRKHALAPSIRLAW